MEKSLFGLFTAFLTVICLCLAVVAARKKRYGLGVIFLLNSFSNLVTTIQAFYGSFF
ncbi:hypothetical protein [Streptococcus sp. zg-JUN1979]|uniref:hypothetical protein n=1 Tax=Streptococcus sp. zg-JUN1979 TaxID=3391450 RepID=UPI0039A68470